MMGEQKQSMAYILKLAFQSIGVVYGDLGTSPLYVYSSTSSSSACSFRHVLIFLLIYSFSCRYVYSSTFTSGIKTNLDILGVLSLIIYTIIAVPLVKYIFIVLRANDNGEGGTFALYSLICRHVKIGLAHNRQPTDLNISSYKLETPSGKMKRSTRIKEALENSKALQNVLLVVVLLGPCLVIGDGSLTPAISVLSAIQGIGVQVQGLSPSKNEDHLHSTRPHPTWLQHNLNLILHTLLKYVQIKFLHMILSSGIDIVWCAMARYRGDHYDCGVGMPLQPSALRHSQGNHHPSYCTLLHYITTNF